MTDLRHLQTVSEISTIWRPKRLLTIEFIGPVQINISIYLFAVMSDT